MLKVISRSPTDLQRVLDTIVETAQNLSSSYDAAIVLREGEGMRVRAIRGPFRCAPNGRPLTEGQLRLVQSWTGRQFMFMTFLPPEPSSLRVKRTRSSWDIARSSRCRCC